MKNFQSEAKELFDVMMKIEKDYSASLREKSRGQVTKDSDELFELQKARRMYHLKFLELKQKYHIELTSEEKNILERLRKTFADQRKD